MRFLSIFLVLAGLAYGQESEVRAAERNWAKAVTAGDGGGLQKLLGDQLIYTHSSGVLDTKGSYISKILSGRQKYEGADYQETTVKFYGATAVLHARVHMWGTNPSGKFDDRLIMLHVWWNDGGQWRLVAHQTTKLP